MVFPFMLAGLMPGLGGVMQLGSIEKYNITKYNDKILFPIKTVSLILNISEYTLRKKIREKLFPAKKIEGIAGYQIDPDDLKKYISDNYDEDKINDMIFLIDSVIKYHNSTAKNPIQNSGNLIVDSIINDEDFKKLLPKEKIEYISKIIEAKKFEQEGIELNLNSGLFKDNDKEQEILLSLKAKSLELRQVVCLLEAEQIKLKNIYTEKE